MMDTHTRGDLGRETGRCILTNATFQDSKITTDWATRASMRGGPTVTSGETMIGTVLEGHHKEIIGTSIQTRGICTKIEGEMNGTTTETKVSNTGTAFITETMIAMIIDTVEETGMIIKGHQGVVEQAMRAFLNCQHPTESVVRMEILSLRRNSTARNTPVNSK